MFGGYLLVKTACNIVQLFMHLLNFVGQGLVLLMTGSTLVDMFAVVVFVYIGDKLPQLLLAFFQCVSTAFQLMNCLSHDHRLARILQRWAFVVHTTQDLFHPGLGRCGHKEACCSSDAVHPETMAKKGSHGRGHLYSHGVVCKTKRDPNALFQLCLHGNCALLFSYLNISIVNAHCRVPKSDVESSIVVWSATSAVPFNVQKELVPVRHIVPALS